MGSNKVYRMAEAAIELGVSRPMVYKLVAQGDLRAIRVGTERRITAGAIETYLRAREVAAEQIAAPKKKGSRLRAVS